jgi:hypothetical protein
VRDEPADSAGSSPALGLFQDRLAGRYNWIVFSNRPDSHRLDLCAGVGSCEFDRTLRGFTDLPGSVGRL